MCLGGGTVLQVVPQAWEQPVSERPTSVFFFLLPVYIFNLSAATVC